MSILDRLSIRTRLMVLLGLITGFTVLLIGMLAVGMSDLSETGAASVEDGLRVAEENRLQTAVHSMALVLGHQVAGLGTDGAAAVIREATGPIRFEADSSGYFFVYQGTVAVSVPAKPQVEGTDLGESADPNGILFVRELKQRAEAGGGFVRYTFAKPGAGDQPKLAYAEMIPGTPFWIGTGIYVDNIETARAALLGDLHFLERRYVGFALGALLLLVFIVGIPANLWIRNHVVRPLRAATTAAMRISEGDLAVDLPAAAAGATRNEAELLTRSFHGMIGYLRDMAAAAAHLAEGDLDSRVAPRSERDVLAREMERATRALRALVGGVDELLRAAEEGELDRRLDSRSYLGAYRQLGEGTNRLLEAVARPLTEASNVLGHIARRDLRPRMTGEYKGGYAAMRDTLNAALDNMEDALREVSEASAQVATASDEIAAGSQDLAQSSSEQAASLEEVSSSLQELASMAKQNAANAREAQSLTDAASASTAEGAEAMSVLTTTMQRIKDSSDATSRIVRTIDEIAFQTNLLALNAAVEAARAGDAGKGFAVVAEEVRSLAMRSAEAARETSRLIEESVRSSEDGVAVQVEVVGKLDGIRGSVARVREVMIEIATASEHQTEGVGQINHAVEDMNAVTQRAAASSEESASAATELSAQAQGMSALVARFQLAGAGTGRAVPPRDAARRRPAPRPAAAF